MAAASGTIAEGVQAPLVAGRRRIARSCLTMLAILGGCVAIVAMGVGLLTLQCSAEIRAVSPWPGVRIPAHDVATVDLGYLGLETMGTVDPQDVYGPGGAYDDAAIVEYGAGGARVATFAALRYSDIQGAHQDFAYLANWAQESCSPSWWTSRENYGVISCDHAEGHNRILWNDRWILDIDATSHAGMEDLTLVNEIRDAAAAEWHRR